ncbi:hypothetical protein [uncultured Dokdonia sp.]|nr:hypothetical protein [uncultured Dokdonia sp.]
MNPSIIMMLGFLFITLSRKRNNPPHHYFVKTLLLDSDLYNVLS